jgi:hypothetical protein
MRIPEQLAANLQYYAAKPLSNEEKRMLLANAQHASLEHGWLPR